MQSEGVSCKQIGVLSFANVRANTSPEVLANCARSLGISACIVVTSGTISPPTRFSLRLYRILDSFAGIPRSNDPISLGSNECEQVREHVAREALDVLLSPIPILDVCEVAT